MANRTIVLSDESAALVEAQLRRAIARKVTKLDKALLWVEEFETIDADDPRGKRWCAKASRHAADLRHLADALTALTDDSDGDVLLAKTALDFQLPSVPERS